VLEKTDAVILAGGLGKRLRVVVSDRPKPMAEINGRPFILYLFDQLIEVGLSRVIVSTGYLRDYFRRELGTRYRTLEIVYSEEQLSLGTAGALKLATKHLTSENVLVMNGDTYLDVDFVDFFSCHCRWQSEVTLALTTTDCKTQFGQVEIDVGGEITRFDEKSIGQGDDNWVNAGYYFIQTDTIKNIPTSYPLSLERDLFPSLTKTKFYGYKTSGKFVDIGTPQSLQHAQFLLENIRD
jgi:NDP-sugar pyrophosphorylase family protein